MANRFHGETYSEILDGARLGQQLQTVRDLVLDGQWRGLADIRCDSEGPGTQSLQIIETGQKALKSRCFAQNPALRCDLLMLNDFTSGSNVFEQI